MRRVLFLAAITVMASHSAETKDLPITPASQDAQVMSAKDGRSVNSSQVGTTDLTERKVHVRRDDTLLQILRNSGISTSVARAALNALSSKFNPRSLQVGETLRLYFMPSPTPGRLLKFVGLILGEKGARVWMLDRSYNGGFRMERVPFHRAVSNIHATSHANKPRDDGRIIRKIVVQRGDTLTELLLTVGADLRSARLASKAISKGLDLRKLRPGQTFTITLAPTPEELPKLRLLALDVQIASGRFVTASRLADGTFVNKPLTGVLDSTSDQSSSSTTTPSAKVIKSQPPETTTESTAKKTDTSKLLENSPTHPSKHRYVQNDFQLRKGDILFNRIVSIGAHHSDTHYAVEALGKFINLRRLHVGQKFTILFYEKNDGARQLASVRMPRRGRKTIEIGRVKSGRFAEGPPDDEFFVTETAGNSQKLTTTLTSTLTSSNNSKTENTAAVLRTAAPLAETFRSIPTTRRMKSLNVNPGDTLYGLLQKAGSLKQDARLAVQSMHGVHDPDLIRAGQELVITFDADGRQHRLIGIVLGINKHSSIVIELDGEQFRARKAPGKDLVNAIELAGKIETARSAIATGNYNSPARELYGFEAEESDLVNLKGAERVKVSLKPGDTLFETMLDAGAPRQDANAAIAAAQKIVDPRKLRAGQNVALAFISNSNANKQTGSLTLAELAIDLSPEQRLRVARMHDGEFVSGLVRRPLNPEYRRAVGTIQNSLYKAAATMGLPTEVLIKLIRIFSYDVDFQRDIRKGDRFEVLYESYTDEDGELVRTSALLYAALTLSGTKLGLYRFTLDDGFTDYFDEQGQSARKALMRTPIDGARLTSTYGKRKHPTLGYSKMHRGVDFGASSGTPIYAAGDGVVEHIGRNGAYGKYIRLRHGPKYQTAYAHLNRYAKGMQRAKRVKQGQVIGYVGSTGRSTGPHLHYEVLVNGKQANPLGVKLPTGMSLKGFELIAFEVRRDQLRNAYASVPTRRTLADSDDPKYNVSSQK